MPNTPLWNEVIIRPMIATPEDIRPSSVRHTYHFDTLRTCFKVVERANAGESFGYILTSLSDEHKVQFRIENWQRDEPENGYCIIETKAAARKWMKAAQRKNPDKTLELWEVFVAFPVSIGFDLIDEDGLFVRVVRVNTFKFIRPLTPSPWKNYRCSQRQTTPESRTSS